MKFAIKLNLEQIEMLIKQSEKKLESMKSSLKYFGNDELKKPTIERIEKQELLIETLKTHL